MAYQSSVAELRKVLDLGFTVLGTSAGAGISKGNSVFLYVSSHAAETFGESTGFFTGCGAQRYSSTGTPPFDSITRSTKNVGLQVGDLVVAIESSDGSSGGRVTWHCGIESTYGTDGFDVTVSRHAST